MPYNSGFTSLGRIAIPDGTALAPNSAFSSEASLGFWRSGGSSLALSYGTLDLSSSALSSGGTIILAQQGDAVRFVGGTAHRINWGQIGAAAPTLTSYSAGVKIVLYDSVDAGNVGYTQGIEANTMYFTLTNANAGNAFKWYASTTEIGRLVAPGSLVLPQSSFVSVGSAVTPGYGFSSETSLGFYRSGISTIAISKGTLDLTAGGAVTSIASLTIKSGANNTCGTAVLGSNGSVNVANTYVKTGDLIFLTDQTPGGTLGDLEILGIRNSSGFTVASTSITDTSTVAWLIVRPG